MLQFSSHSHIGTLDFFLASRRASRKRHAAASPYSDIDLNTLIRYSPTASLALLNSSAAAAAAAAAMTAASASGSPNSSGSYGHLSTGRWKQCPTFDLSTLKANNILLFSYLWWQVTIA